MFNGFYKNKRVFVTGHTGFKGSWLTQWLLRQGATVAGYSRGIETEPALFNLLRLASQITHIEGDVRNGDAIASALQKFQPEIVFHLAAQALTRLSYDDPKLTFETNVLGTINVLEALRKIPSVRAAVFITSDKCYENVEWNYGYRETDALGGKDPYSASKACAEIAFSAYARSFYARENAPAIATVRAGNVIGGGDWARDRIVPDCMRAWSAHETLTIRSPRATRPWQHVLEPLSGYLWLGAVLAEKKLSGRSYNFGPQSEVVAPVINLIEALARRWPGGKWEIVTDPHQKAEASLLKLNCDKALAELAWLPTLTLEENIEFTGDWYNHFYQKGARAESLTLRQIERYQTLAAERSRVWAQTAKGIL